MMKGDAGDDAVIGDDGDDFLSGGLGNDSLDGADGTDTIAAGVDDTLTIDLDDECAPDPGPAEASACATDDPTDEVIVEDDPDGDTFDPGPVDGV